jgi:hypothetical protein
MSQPRTESLLAARAAASHDKRQRALDAIAALESSGDAVTFPAVARAAGVSTWLVYATGVREHVETARKRQHSTPPPERGDLSPAGARTDLVLARAEIRTLREEADKLRGRLRLQLGAEIQGPQRAELIDRVADLEETNRRLVAEHDARRCEDRLSERRAHELEDELTAAREALRRMIRAQNTTR